MENLSSDTGISSEDVLAVLTLNFDLRQLPAIAVNMGIDGLNSPS